ncbi:MAG TPA: hypothetical protein VE291_06850 [Terracidiphilus sp.]|jgi:hypothetical protein|nr:hypothetical protein [Terracidiphilus sp.]
MTRFEFKCGTIRRVIQRASTVVLCGVIAMPLLSQNEPPPPALQTPISVYNNWSSYDELSDNIPLTESLAMRELDELLRLKEAGVRFDYYMMDAFWFAPDGGYRTWRAANWPNGPDAWINKCRANGVLPGMWFSTNTLVKIQAAPAWKDSLNKDGGAMSFFEGGFLPDFMNALQYWYDHGIRMFKFDFVDLSAATPASAAKLSVEEIRERNANAFRAALLAFRARNPQAVLIAFNGFGGDLDNTFEPLPFHDATDLRWLSVFQMQYTGDPRPSDVPEANFWRSMDIYSDHMVRRFEQLGFPLERIDSTGFMVGKTGTIYYRGLHAWKGAYMLMMARGGWVNTVHGNIELIQGKDASWMARAQALFFELQGLGRIHTFGGIPGDIEPYGFAGVTTRGSIYVAMNPGQTVATLTLPPVAFDQKPLINGKVQFRDAGFTPVLNGNKITLGPGQMAMVGYGDYAAPSYDFGIQDDVVIPTSIEPVQADFHTTAPSTIEASIAPPRAGTLRVIMREHTPEGDIRRTWAGGPPDGTNMAKIFTIEATQGERTIPVAIDYDKIIWSGLSWAVGEIKASDLTPGQPVLIRFHSAEKDPVKLEGKAYRVTY